MLKDGRTVGTYAAVDMNEHWLISLMVGRETSPLFPKVARSRGEELLRVEKLCASGLVKDVSFSLHAGEVLGIAGLVGSRRTELARAIFGADRLDSGTISVGGRRVAIRTPRQGVTAGIGLVPEDRKGQDLVLAMPIRQNLTLTCLHRFTNLFGLLRRAAERAAARDVAQRTTIRVRNLDLPVSSLSGGNQQKVVLTKWLDAGCRIIILDEPTRGVDVGARAEIYQLIETLAAGGLSVIVISSEWPRRRPSTSRPATARCGISTSNPSLLAPARSRSSSCWCWSRASSRRASSAATTSRTCCDRLPAPA